MDIVLVGLSGSGKSEVGRRLAEAFGARLIDTDREIERRTGRSIASIFDEDGEAAFRALDRDVVASLSSPTDGPGTARVIITGGGTVIDPRNRWALYRGRRVFWLDAPDDILARRLERSRTVRPLLAGGAPSDRLAAQRRDRRSFYAAGERVDTSGSVADAVATIRRLVATPAPPTPLLREDGPEARVTFGEGISAAALAEELRRLASRRAVILTEPRAWRSVARAIGDGLERLGLELEVVELPEGEPAKRLGVVEAAASELARRGHERDEAIVAVGGGALTDAAGFVAATYQRGVPWIAVPTTLLGQLDAAHGGKVGVDLPEGKNLLGAFHLPTAVVVDPSVLATLPERHRRAALAEAVKHGLLADSRLLDVLEVDGPAVATGDAAGLSERSALAEVVERAMRVKLRFVEADPTEHGDRIALNLGHTLGHAIEAAAGYGPVLHGEAIAYGLRAAVRLGAEIGQTPPAVRARTEALLDRLSLAVDPLPYPLDEVVAMLWTDKKRRGGALRWVLPTADGWSVRDDVPVDLVRAVAATVLSGRGVPAMAR